MKAAVATAQSRQEVEIPGTGMKVRLGTPREEQIERIRRICSIDSSPTPKWFDWDAAIQYRNRYLKFTEYRSKVQLLLEFWARHNYEFHSSRWTRSAIGDLALESPQDARRFVDAYEKANRQLTRNAPRNLAVLAAKRYLQSVDATHAKAAIRWVRKQRARGNKGFRVQLIGMYNSLHPKKCACLTDDWLDELFVAATTGATAQLAASQLLRDLIAMKYGTSSTQVSHQKAVLGSNLRMKAAFASENLGRKLPKKLPKQVS